MLQIFNVIDVCKFRDNNYSIKKWLKGYLWVLVVIFIHMVVSNCGIPILRTVPMSIKENILCVLIGSMSMLINFSINYIIPFILVSDEKKFNGRKEIKENKSYGLRKILSTSMNSSYLN